MVAIMVVYRTILPSLYGALKVTQHQIPNRQIEGKLRKAFHKDGLPRMLQLVLVLIKIKIY